MIRKMNSVSAFRYKRIIWIAVAVLSLMVSFRMISFAAEATDCTDAEGDYTLFSKEVSEMVSDARTSEETKEESVKRRLLIVGKNDLDLSKLKGSYEAVSSGNGLHVIQFETSEDAERAYKELQTWDSVLSVEFDALVRSEAFTAPFARSLGSQSHLSWGAQCIGADTYSAYLKSHNQRKLVVAVVDSGVDSAHHFLSGRLVSGYNFVDDNYDTSDDKGHGTHIAGIIADCTLGIDEIQIMPVKSINKDGLGTLVDIASGLLYACDNSASVINFSVGGEHSYYLDYVVYLIIREGCSLVAAAGNESSDIDFVGACPAHIDEAIVVGAINKNKTVDYYSNYGRTIDFVAPGSDINSTFRNGTYAIQSGTSMAAPHVSACVAMMKLQYSQLSESKLNSLLRRSCDKHADTYRYGNGIINLNNLIAPISKQSISINKKTVEYTGKATKPIVLVKRNNEELFNGSDYTVTYANNKNVGTATAIVQGKGTYNGTKTVNYTIVPKSTRINKIRSERKSFTLKWKKQTRQTSGYEIQYSLKKNFKSAKSLFVKRNKTTSKKIKKLKRNRNYYVRIRTYKTVNGKKYYSAWSKKKKVKTK